MKKIIILFLVVGSLHSYAQSKSDHQNGVITDSLVMQALKDTTITVEYVKKSNPKPPSKVAYFINGEFSSVLDNISPDQVESITIGKRDTIITGKKYDGMVFIKLNGHPNKYVRKMISLNELKNKYTTLENQPALFTIDGKLINANYDLYQIDKNTVFKIVVDKFVNSESYKNLWLVEVLTKTKENIHRSKIMMLRGASGLVKN